MTYDQRDLDGGLRPAQRPPFRASSHDDALARLQRTHPKIWRPERWLWEAVTLGVVLAGLITFIYLMSLAIHALGGPPALLAAMGAR